MLQLDIIVKSLEGPADTPMPPRPPDKEIGKPATTNNKKDDNT